MLGNVVGLGGINSGELDDRVVDAVDQLDHPAPSPGKGSDHVLVRLCLHVVAEAHTILVSAPRRRTAIGMERANGAQTRHCDLVWERKQLFVQQLVRQRRWINPDACLNIRWHSSIE